MHSEITRKNGAIERFYIPGEDGYSEFWRRNKSPIEVIELARLLQALRKVASYIGRNVGDVVWSGMELTQGIALDPGPIIGKYPVPPSKTDIMVGLTVQRAYANTEWSDRIKTIAISHLKLPPPYAYKFNLYFDMCEKVYLDCLSNQSVLGCYTERAREWVIEKNSKQFIEPPIVTELFHIWWKMAADRSGEKYKEEYVDQSVRGLVERYKANKGKLEKFYKQPLELLNSIVDRLINECPKITGVTERGNFRLELYLSIWPRLLEHIIFWPSDREDPFFPSNNFKNEIEKDDEEKKAVNATLIRLADPIERTMRKKISDYTGKVKSNVKNVDDVVQIRNNDIVMRAKNKIDRGLLHHLQLEFKAVAQRITSYNRGLTSGKIDRRRLYRACTNGAVFQLKEDEFQLPSDFVLLVDATGSMSELNKWDKTETIFQTLFSVIVAYSKNAKLFAYNEVGSICRLSELYMGGGFFTILPHGQTASGEAIIATALNLKIGLKRRPFIIHITDGASNWGCGVNDAITFCKKKKIKLLTLGIECGPSDKQSLRKEYGRLVQFLDNINNLPSLVKSLLRYSK